jgi:hypothetical protein
MQDGIKKQSEFDFDYWMKLAEKDPAAFERQRLDLIQTTIQEAPTKMQKRLNGLQWQIDSEIKLAKNPMDACLRIYQKMMDSVYEPGGLLDALTMSENAVKSDNIGTVVLLNDPERNNSVKKTV